MSKPVINIIMGSHSDLEQVRPCCQTCEEFKVPYELKILSAHRTPKRLARFVEDSAKKGVKIFIAAAGGAAALAGTVAAHTTLPVIGIPIRTSNLSGLDSLLSTVQMPAGVPVACMAIGKSGARNAAIFALQILALSDKKIANKLRAYKKSLS
ncbi:MAG: 5-(carboxyamino)imidazole ribonucleotide mutase [Candidatus Omnitrophota bacterium]